MDVLAEDEAMQFSGCESMVAASTPPAPRDANQAFRGGGQSLAWLDQINKASIVMLAATGIVPRPIATRIAAGIERLIAEQRLMPAQWSADYLDYEPRLVAAIGQDATRLHCGRSRQDMAATIARMNLRDGLLEASEALSAARKSLLTLAQQHTCTIVPAYTHGVQAQPTTFAHFLLALAGALGRQAARLQAAYARVNQCPLGAAALATSSIPVDRDQLAALLGFEGLVENSYDANHLAPVDSSMEVAGVLAIFAVQLGQFAQDLHAQFAAPSPWLALRGSELTGVSSIMPQKRNPAALEQLRAQSSILLGEMQAVCLMAHNARTGMFDYRAYDPVPSARSVLVLDLLRKVIDALVVDGDRARAEVQADYSTTTEIADALLQRADVPFRIGHHFASALTDYGRSNALKLHEIPYEHAARLYDAQTEQAFPLSEQDFREVISADYVVFGRKGIGGPQCAEVERMLVAERDRLASDLAWAARRRAQLAQTRADLDQAVNQLATNPISFTAPFPSTETAP